jgi:hypothetical protein
MIWKLFCNTSLLQRLGFCVLLLAFYSPLFSSPSEVILVDFQPFKTKEDSRVSAAISQKLTQTLESRGFAVKQVKPSEKQSYLGDSKSSQSFLIHGYYSRG